MTQRFTGTKNITPNGDQTISASSGNIKLITTSTGQVFGNSGANVGNPLNVPYDSNNIFDSIENRQQGAAYFTGGVGIEKDLNVGGFIYGRVAVSNTSAQVIITATNVDSFFYPAFTDQLGLNGAFLYADNQSEFASEGLRYNPYTGMLLVDQITVASTASSTSPTTGAFTVTGGVGVLGDVYIGGSEYVDNLYTKFIRSTQGPVTVAPASGLTEIVGNIRVQGTNPIGTAPVVTNVLYVTMDGDDTNDGRAQDASRACRTIGGAVKSPYFQPGTQIIVSAGRYLENNPILLKPYTSVKGSDIRTTFIEPINKTQDLFHLQSGCYLNYMTFLNGRSGLLDGPYANGYNRGAFATSFPPQEGNNRIDLFHSPYVQNCTNQSGPWLKDGTMFIPDQTVQVPTAVGTGSWEANTTTIQVTVLNSSTLSLGQSINSGQQNQGFFDARSLLLANKPFLQAQVVAYVDNTFNSGSFVYNQAKCFRDTGLIIDSIGMDMLSQSHSDSTFTGLQYWNQGGLTGQLVTELTTTTAAINYVRDTIDGLISGIDGGVAARSIVLFNKITSILNGGTVGITDQIESNGLASTSQTTIDSFNAMQSAKASIQADTIDYVVNTLNFTEFNTATCYRDVGYIIDSVSFDLLHGGNLQSIKSGVYYYSYTSTSTAIPNEIPQTTAAYNFIKSIIPNIVTGKTILAPYQNIVPQTTATIPATIYQAEALQANIDVITNIIRNGPGVADDKTPQSMSVSSNEELVNAYNILEANRGFIQAEVIAYINSSFNTFDYNRQLCYRDTGILVENMSYDMAFGGNQKSVESGLAYYRGVTSVIAGQETQTISAIDYLSQLSEQIIVNSTCTVLIPPAGIPTANQVINTALTNGAIASDSIKKLFNITTDIILKGPTAAPDSYTSPGPDSAFVSAEILMQANRAFIQEEVINYINYSLVQPQSTTYLPYNQIKCRRDTGLIVDSIGLDLLFPTAGFSQSNYTGLQYWNSGNYTGQIKSQLTPTIDAVNYLKELSIKVITNVTTATDALVGVTRYSDSVQTTASNYATSVEISNIAANFGIVLNILGGNTEGWTDQIVMSGSASTLPSVQNTYALLQANKGYLADEVVAYVSAVNPGYTYSTSTCHRDVGYIIDSISFDLLYGGNRQSIQSGFSYYGFNGDTAIPNETTATVDAFAFLGSLASNVVQGIVGIPQQTKVKQITSLPLGDQISADILVQAVSTITNIIANGAGVAGPLVPISLIENTSPAALNAFDLLEANRTFIVEEVIAYINNSYNNSAFSYNQELCYRDTGLIIDAVSQDILLGGNAKSLEAGLSYWNQGYNYVTGQETTTTLAINFARDLALQIVSNTPVVPQTGTVAKQIINPFFENGGAYMPTQAIRRNFDMITNIISNGPGVAPPLYTGGGLFALTGLNGSDVNIAPTITALTQLDTSTYLVGLSKPTIGFGINSTLYFGDIYVFPLTNIQVEAKSLEYTNSSTTWNSRKLDPIGSMGGSLVDGGVISDRSPIQSFVYDAYTQVNQGGVGVKITNNGYAQLVSVFTIFCSIAVEVDNGGIASITNSNCNFGDLGLVSKGYGTRSFSGTVFNPPFRSYPFSPSTTVDYLDQYYPSGFWPKNGSVEIFLPDSADRPHIGQVMEVIPPEDHINEQTFSGFLNAQPSTGTLVTGSIVLENISNADIAIGNTLHIRDQYGFEFDNFEYRVDNFGNFIDIDGNVLADQSNANVQINGVINPNFGKWYASTGTVVTDLGYNSITLNKALTLGGGDPTNPNFFTLYFCGNSYYTVLTSDIAIPPYRVDHNILEANTDPNFQGPLTDQISAHVSSINYLGSLVDSVINNIQVAVSPGNNLIQYTNGAVTGGSGAQAFIDLRFGYITDIIGATTATYNTIVPQSAITRTGTIPAGAGSAIDLISHNLDFLAAEVYAHLRDDPAFTSIFDGLTADQIAYIETKCARDVNIILQRIIYDLDTGGNYNSVYAGLSYWGREGTHHVVGLGEAVNRTDLFPDGSTVNFYQRSYISASGYLFEYVGAGTNYGSLPQRGVKDPTQSQETIQLDSGKVFFTSTDQNGDFRIGPGLVISQATGVLSGRTFTQSLFANMTPFILAIEG
jgi:hypothetical protein